MTPSSQPHYVVLYIEVDLILTILTCLGHIRVSFTVTSAELGVEVVASNS